jgi:hypothetical protein
LLFRWSGVLPRSEIRVRLRKLRAFCDEENPIAQAPRGRRFILDVLLELEVVVKRLPSFFDKIWFR